MSTRDVLRQSKTKVYPCEISSGTVYIRSLSGKGRADYIGIPEEKGMRPLHKIAALGLCEEDGKLCFGDDINEMDAEELKDMDGEDLQKIVMKLFEVSGLSKESGDDAEKK